MLPAYNHTIEGFWTASTVQSEVARWLEPLKVLA
jgi:hypothetical protein